MWHIKFLCKNTQKTTQTNIQVCSTCSITISGNKCRQCKWGVKERNSELPIQQSVVWSLFGQCSAVNRKVCCAFFSWACWQVGENEINAKEKNEVNCGSMHASLSMLCNAVCRISCSTSRMLSMTCLFTAVQFRIGWWLVRKRLYCNG